MAVQTYSHDINAIFATTLSKHRAMIADSAFRKNVTSFVMLARNRVIVEAGGRDIIEPVQYRKNPNVQFYSGFERFQTTPSDEFTAAVYQWKQLGATVSISGLDSDVKNAGDAQLIDLLAAKVENLEDTFRTVINETFTKDTTRGNKEFLGLSTFIEAGTYGVVGGIDGNTNEWWRNKYATAQSDYSDIFTAMNNMFHNCTKGGKRPQLILTTQSNYEGYENEIVQGQNSASNMRIEMPRNGGLLDAGFESLRYKGADLVWDDVFEDGGVLTSAGTDPMYFLNFDVMKFRVHPNRNFAMKGFVEPYDQDAQVAKMLMAGNLCSNSRRHLGLIVFNQ